MCAVSALPVDVGVHVISPEAASWHGGLRAVHKLTVRLSWSLNCSLEANKLTVLKKGLTEPPHSEGSWSPMSCKGVPHTAQAVDVVHQGRLSRAWRFVLRASRLDGVSGESHD